MRRPGTLGGRAVPAPFPGLVVPRLMVKRGELCCLRPRGLGVALPLPIE